MRAWRWRMMARGRHGAGFTLVEIVLVAIVIGALLVSSVPGFVRTMERLRAERSAFELAQLLRSAREQAVTGGDPVTWSWDPQTRRVRLEAIPEGPQPPDPDEEPADGAEESAALPEGLDVTLERAQDPVDCRCVRFFPDGTGESTTLVVTLNEHHYTITVQEATGQVGIRSGAAAR